MAKRLHLFSLFFSVLTFSNLGRRFAEARCQGMIWNFHAGLSHTVGTRFPTVQRPCSFFTRPRPQGSDRQHGGCLLYNRSVSS